MATIWLATIWPLLTLRRRGRGFGQCGPLDPVDGVRHLGLVDGSAPLQIAVAEVGVVSDLVSPLSDLQVAAAAGRRRAKLGPLPYGSVRT